MNAKITCMQKNKRIWAIRTKKTGTGPGAHIGEASSAFLETAAQNVFIVIHEPISHTIIFKNDSLFEDCLSVTWIEKQNETKQNKNKTE